MRKIGYIFLMISLIIILAACGQKANSAFEVTEKIEEYIGKSDDEMLVINNSRNVVSVTSINNKEAARKINEFLSNHSELEWKNICEETNWQVKAVNENNVKLEEVVDYYGVRIFTSKLFENDKYISFTVKQDGSMGGVGWNSIKEFNFDKSTGELLDVVNIVNDVDAFENKMYEYCVNYVKTETDLEDVLWNDDISGNWQEILKNQMFANGNWGLTDNGIEFVFEKYVLGPGVAGTIVIDVPYEF